MASPTLDFLSSLVDASTTASEEAARRRLERAQQNIEEIFGAADGDSDDLLGDDFSDLFGDADEEDDKMWKELRKSDPQEYHRLMAVRRKQEAHERDVARGRAFPVPEPVEAGDLAFGDDFDDLLGDDSDGDLGGDEEDFGDEDFGDDEDALGAVVMSPLGIPLPPRAVYTQMAKSIAHALRKGHGSKPAVKKRIERARKLWAKMSKGKLGPQHTAGLMSPDQIIAAATKKTSSVASASAPAPQAYTPRPQASSVAPAYTPRPQASSVAPAYTNRPRQQAPNPYDASVAPHLRRGYRTLVDSGRLWPLFNSFPNHELNLIAARPHGDPRVSAMASKIVSMRAAQRQAQYVKPSYQARPRYAHPQQTPSTLQVLARPTYVRPAYAQPASTYTPTSRAVATTNARYTRGGARYAGDDDFGAELPAGYEATPTLWTSVTSHPVAAVASAAAVFGVGVFYADKVKDTLEDAWYGRMNY